jgi:hypothetical protein
VASKRYFCEGVPSDCENFPNLIKLVKETRSGDVDESSISSYMFTIYLLKNNTLYINAVQLLCILDLHNWDLIKLADNIKSNFTYNLANMKISFSKRNRGMTIRVDRVEVGYQKA